MCGLDRLDTTKTSLYGPRGGDTDSKTSFLPGMMAIGVIIGVVCLMSRSHTMSPPPPPPDNQNSILARFLSPSSEMSSGGESGDQSTKNPNPNPNNEKEKRRNLDLGNGSEIIYIPRFLPFDESWKWLHYLDKEIPWTRPSIHVFGRSCIQPRDTCYVADKGLQELRYSGYQPHAYSWDDYPPLKEILAAVHEALPGSNFNSLLLNRYKCGSDYVAWHSDDEKLYGPTPEIASVSFGCEREFLLKKRPSKKTQEQVPTSKCEKQPPRKRLKTSSHDDQHSFVLKPGSLLVMRGYTQRDWLHSVPKRAKADSVRINLTFRHVRC